MIVVSLVLVCKTIPIHVLIFVRASWAATVILLIPRILVHFLLFSFYCLLQCTVRSELYENTSLEEAVIETSTDAFSICLSRSVNVNEDIFWFWFLILALHSHK